MYYKSRRDRLTPCGLVLMRSFNPSCDCTYMRLDLVLPLKFVILDVAEVLILFFIYLLNASNKHELGIIHKT